MTQPYLYNGFTIRPGTDKQVVDEVYRRRVYQRHVPILRGDHWLDVGAHVGTFSKLVLEHGASVFAVEPSPDSAALWRENVVGQQAQLFEGAVGATTGTATLYFANETNPCGDSLYVKRGRERAVEVEVLGAIDLLRAQKPNKVKLDAEGAEVEVLEAILAAPWVDAVVGEYHLNMRRAREAWPELRERLEAAFERRVIKPDPPGKAWHLQFAFWQRSMFNE